MSTVAQLQIEMSANVARIARDMANVRSTVGGVMQQVESRVQQTMSLLSKFGVGFAGLEGIRAVSNLSDDFVKLNGQLKIATATQQEYVAAQQSVAQIANSSQANLNAIGTLYSRISNASKDLNVSQGQVAQITQTVALALKAGGASTEESASAMLQLSQAFGSGYLRGQEFNAVAEAAPNLLRALAESIGVPYGQLKNMAAQGELTTDVLVKAFTNPALIASLKDQASQLQTVGGAVTVVKNNLELAIGQFNDATGASRILAQGLGTLANNMDVVVRAGVGLVGVFATKQVLNYSANLAQVTANYFTQSQAAAAARDAVAAESAAKIASLTATQEAIALSQAESVAKLKTANATVAAAEAQLQASRAVGVYSAALFAVREAEVAAAAATQARSVALAELSALGTQAASVQAKLAAATEAANLATAASGATASIAARALGFLGGPIGAITTVLTLGATAWAIWGGKAEENEQKASGAVEKSTQDIIAGLDQQISKLKERNNLAAAGVSTAGGGNEAGDRLAKIYGQIQEVQNRGTLDGQNIPNQSAKIAILASLGQQYGQLADRIREVNDEQKKATDGQNQQSLDNWLQHHQQYATEEQKVAMAIASAQKELGSAFTPEIAQKIRDSIVSSKGSIDKLSSSAQRLYEDTRTPLEKFGAKVTEINMLLAKGLISKDTASRATDQAKQVFDDSQFKSLYGLSDALAELKVKWDEEEKAKQAMAKEAATVFNETRTPLEQLSAKLASLQVLFDNGQISADTFGRAVLKAKTDFDDVGKKGKTTLDDLKFAVQGFGKDSAQAFVDFAVTGKKSFSGLVDSMLTDLARLAVQKQVTDPFFKAVSDAIPAGGGSASGFFSKIGSSVGSFFKNLIPTFADGGIMTQWGPMKLNAYAGGGVVSSPQMYVAGEGSMNEAIIPLPDGRSVPVNLKGSMGGGGDVQVNIYNQPGQTATVKQSTGAGGIRQLDILIEQVGAGISKQIAKGSGSVPATLETVYGLNRGAGLTR